MVFRDLAGRNWPEFGNRIVVGRAVKRDMLDARCTAERCGALTRVVNLPISTATNVQAAFGL
jgi:hypothetical protein